MAAGSRAPAAALMAAAADLCTRGVRPGKPRSAGRARYSGWSILKVLRIAVRTVGRPAATRRASTALAQDPLVLLLDEPF
jgi:hypothetical protein